MSEARKAPAQKPSAQELLDRQKRIQELTVLDGELASLRKGARVYKQQPNSRLFFLHDKTKVFTDARGELDGLVQEYKEAEKSSAQLEKEEQETED